MEGLRENAERRHKGRAYGSEEEVFFFFLSFSSTSLGHSFLIFFPFFYSSFFFPILSFPSLSTPLSFFPGNRYCHWRAAAILCRPRRLIWLFHNRFPCFRLTFFYFFSCVTSPFITLVSVFLSYHSIDLSFFLSFFLSLFPYPTGTSSLSLPISRILDSRSAHVGGGTGRRGSERLPRQLAGYQHDSPEPPEGKGKRKKEREKERGRRRKKKARGGGKREESIIVNELMDGF